MKRFHAHVNVDDLAASILFYNNLFGQEPSLEKPDYAKWMLDDPRINFAISTRSAKPGVDHFGFQAETEDELGELKQRAVAASGDTILDEGNTTCCYAESNKHWTTDPSGIAWEHYLTMCETKSYGKDRSESDSACCATQTTDNKSQQTERNSCC